MQPNKYQKSALRDLSRYLELLNQTLSIEKAYDAFWLEKGVLTGFHAVKKYQETIKGVPQLCFKIPTGGGKTYLACNAIRPIFDALPVMKAKVVVWLVPSDAILEQTVKNLKNTAHDYRQKIDVDFQHNVEVYTKQELLNAQNFDPVTVSEQLSVMVLSYDSFRSRGKEGLKAYQENSNLVPHHKAYGKPEQPIDKADETSLFQIINQLNPLVIVDESHHATSALSLEMLRNFNPCFVLELTATPKKESNILTFVDAAQLKKEKMVKLPVVVYNRSRQEKVLVDAIDLRNHLEQQAIEERKITGNYIRPIVLFQAQPKGKENSTTFEKLRSHLEALDIPSNQIAIKTADVNELKNVDLMSEDCEIRYIITVNALKEGWDCPFAYILASLANRTSQVDVEQILGRVLRLPHAELNQHIWLNMSYVLTSSNDFSATLKGIVKALNSAGFSSKDYRCGSMGEDFPTDAPTIPDTPQQDTPVEDNNGVPDFDPEVIRKLLEERRAAEQKQMEQSTGDSSAVTVGVSDILDHSRQVGEEYNMEIQSFFERPNSDLPLEIANSVRAYAMNPEYAEDARSLFIPQFKYQAPALLAFGQYDGKVLLDDSTLNKGFTLRGKSYEVDFSYADADIARVDVERSVEGDESKDSLPKVYKMDSEEQRYFKQNFSNLPQDERIQKCKSIIHARLNKLNGVDSAELEEYVNLIVSHMDSDQLAMLEKSPEGVAQRIRDKIHRLMKEHQKKQFDLWTQTGRIFCEPQYRLPEEIAPPYATTDYGKSLYTAEEDNLNRLESKFILELTSYQNVRWWHRNISRHGFCLNGFVNHYPDIIIRTVSGKVILAETKGNDRDNSDTKQKISLGQTWANLAGSDYLYFMIFDDDDAPLDGAITLSDFLSVLKEL